MSGLSSGQLSLPRGHPACTQNGSAIATSETPNYGTAAVPVIDAGTVSRLAVIGDVHGNAVAFAAVLYEIRRDPPDLVVVNGDLSWGAEPAATLAMADELPDALFVRGNAESALLRLAADEMSEPTETDNWMLLAARRRSASTRSRATPAPSWRRWTTSGASSAATAHRGAIRSS